MLKNTKLYNIVILLLGIFSTMPIIAIFIGGKTISLFSICLILFFILSLLKASGNHSLKITYEIKLYVCWSFFSIVSCFFGMLMFKGLGDRWASAPLTGVPKIIIYLATLVVVQLQKDTSKLFSSFMTGLLIGITVNVIWAILDALIFYSLNISITNTFFSKYIASNDIRYGMLSLTINNVMRSGGLNSDPANIGLFASILATYGLLKKNNTLFVIAILGVLASISIVGLTGLIGSTIVSLFLKDNRNKKTVLFAVFLAAFVILFLLNFSPNNVVGIALDNVLSRIEYKQKAYSDSLRFQYFKFFVPALINNPFFFLIGTGYGTASYAYQNPGFVNTTIPYDPECTYFSYIFDIGFFGFLVYLYLNYKLYKKVNTLNFVPVSIKSMSYSFIIGSFFALWGYHYTLYAPIMLFTVFLTSVSNDTTVDISIQ